MNRAPSTLLALVLAADLGAVALQAEEQRRAREVRPSYSRARVERSEVPEPEQRSLPEALRIAVPRDPRDLPETANEPGSAARTRRQPAESDRHDEIRSRAHEAGEWAAVEALDRHGRSRLFEVGFRDGLHDGFRRSRRDRWELEEGRRAGLFDPQAIGLGGEIGYEESRLVAAEEARRLVIEQFGDLSREPVRLAAPPPPPYRASGFAVAEPQLRDVFSDLSWRGPRDRGLRHLRLDPWRLHRSGSHRDFYDRGWSTPRFGLELWRKRHGRNGWLRGLDPNERRLFDEWFETAFDSALARRFARVADHAFDRGYDAGWRYGIRIGREWQFRRGYHLGFETAVVETARAAFASGFRPAWAAVYTDLFAEWSTTVKLEARAAVLRDGNDDGVFEPGETLYADLELVNFGGGAGRREASLTGAVLSGAERRTIDLPRRSLIESFEPLRAVVRPSVASVTETVVTVSIGELAETLPLRVSHVLRLGPGLRLAGHDALRGTAVVDIRLSNTSRRPVLANLEANLRRGTLRRPSRRLPEIPAGSSRDVRFEIHDLQPLDLLAGELVLTVDSATGGRPQDRLEARLPELATDLDDHSLVDYLLWLGSSPTPDRSEVRRAHELMLRRLAADWRAAVEERGNPYKSDLRGGGHRTALGDLVAAARAASGRTVDRTVFTGLVPRIDELSRSLPGTHPFLRRSMRKLGRELR